MQITEHFTLEEMAHSEAATRMGLYNDPPPDLIPNIIAVAKVLEIVREAFNLPIHVLSCYRSPAVNEAVGGSKTSAHKTGSAADFTIKGVSVKEVCEWCVNNLHTFDQVIYEFGESGWTHLGLSNAPRRQALTAQKQNGRTVYLPGIVSV